MSHYIHDRLVCIYADVSYEGCDANDITPLINWLASLLLNSADTCRDKKDQRARDYSSGRP